MSNDTAEPDSVVQLPGVIDLTEFLFDKNTKLNHAKKNVFENIVVNSQLPC